MPISLPKALRGIKLVHILLLLVIIGVVGCGIVATILSISPETRMSSYPLSISCREGANIFVQLSDKNGNKIADAPINFYSGDEEVDKLYTDKNGRVLFHLPINPQDCGREVKLIAKHWGSVTSAPAELGIPILAKAPARITLSMPKETTTSESVFAVATLTNGITNQPIAGENIMVGESSGITDGNGSAVLKITFRNSGTFEQYAYFEGSSQFEKVQSNLVQVSVIKPACTDGTEIGRCSGSYLCTNNRELKFSCDRCGCPSGLICDSNSCITEGKRVENLVKLLEESMVQVNSDKGIGSGVIISQKGSEEAILTNRHVVDPDFTGHMSNNLKVIDFNEKETRPNRVVIAPNNVDLAIIYIKGYIGAPVEIDYENDSVKRGAGILVMGSPLGIQNSVSEGIVSNFLDTNTSSGYKYQAIQIDAAVNPGNSGGGVFLKSTGKLVGITSFKGVLNQGQLAEGLGFALPAKLMAEFEPENWKVIYQQ